MINIKSMADLDAIRDDPELWRECYAFLSVCAHGQWSPNLGWRRGVEVVFCGARSC